MNEKIKGILIVIIAMLMASGTTATALLVTRAENITLDSDKTDKTNVAYALDDLYLISSNLNSCGTSNNRPICKRATTLHTKTCNNGGSCSSSVGVGNNIIYGNETTTEGILNTGDALTCDVNGDGIYDEETERFYYVSDYYITYNNSYDANVVVLIYYNNIIIEDNVMSIINNVGVKYNANNLNSEGPISLLEHIPSSNQWKTLRLFNTNRQLRTESGASASVGGNLSLFSYDDKVARLLTVQEVNKGCSITVGSGTIGEIDNKCRFLLENTNYEDSSYLAGHYLETVRYASAGAVWHIYSNNRSIDYSGGWGTAYGFRPAIEVAKSDIEY